MSEEGLVHWVKRIISRRSPPLYFILTVIIMQGHKKSRNKVTESRCTNIFGLREIKVKLSNVV